MFERLRSDADQPEIALDLPEFGLRGADQAAVRELFRQSVLDFFPKRPEAAAEGAGNVLVYYRPNCMSGPEQIEALIDDAKQLLSDLAGTAL